MARVVSIPSRHRSTRNGSPELSAVIPLHDEQDNLIELRARLDRALETLGVSYEIVLVDDGSRDQTARLIEAWQADDPRVAAVHLSRNFGHQAAVSAGLDHARGRAVVVMDGDLQDPPELIPRLIERWRDGFDVVYAVRRRRREGLIKRIAYAAFYRLLRAISDLDIPLDSGDFCLMDRRVVEALGQLPERRRFVRGLRSFVGFRQVGVEYDRPARRAGSSKYPFRALLGLAIDGLVSFSSYPLRLVTYLGMASAALAAVLTVWVFVDAFQHQTAPRGWASTIVAVLFMGSVQLISLGIIGEYIRLIFVESKGRPSYIVDSYRRGGRAGSAFTRPSEKHPAPLRGPKRAPRRTPRPRSAALPSHRPPYE
jgi:dolichol-phosphate mannosyltransferase